MANKSNQNEQTDADILQCKEDVLRARDIMPPYNTGQEVKPQETTTDKEKTDHIKPTKEKPAEALSSQRAKPEIPRFDLAEEIMAEQRKISATRRKAPGKTIETQKEERVGYTIGQPIPAQPYQQQVIAEIVARDIERLCRGDYSLNSK